VLLTRDGTWRSTWWANPDRKRSCCAGRPHTEPRPAGGACACTSRPSTRPASPTASSSRTPRSS